jgi:hypothetical protein
MNRISNHDIYSLLTAAQRAELRAEFAEIDRRLARCRAGKCPDDCECRQEVFDVTQNPEIEALSAAEEDRLADRQHDEERDRRLLYPRS